VILLVYPFDRAGLVLLTLWLAWHAPSRAEVR
jgi:hypothetical protein